MNLRIWKGVSFDRRTSNVVPASTFLVAGRLDWWVNNFYWHGAGHWRDQFFNHIFETEKELWKMAYLTAQFSPFWFGIFFGHPSPHFLRYVDFGDFGRAGKNFVLRWPLTGLTTGKDSHAGFLLFFPRRKRRFSVQRFFRREQTSDRRNTSPFWPRILGEFFLLKQRRQDSASKKGTALFPAERFFR